jgi:hypothetical protein
VRRTIPLFTLAAVMAAMMVGSTGGAFAVEPVDLG